MSSNLILVKDRVPRSGKGVDSLLNQLGQYMRIPLNKYVQKIIVDVSRPYLYFEKLVRKEEVPPETDLSFHDAIRIVPMEEVVFDNGVDITPLQYIDQMFRIITNHGYETGHILIGKKSGIFKWLDLPRSHERLFGTPLHKIAEIPDDVIIACAAKTRECDPEDIQLSVKVSIP